MSPERLSDLAEMKSNVTLPASTLLALLEKSYQFATEDKLSSDQPARLKLIIADTLSQIKEN